MKHQSPKLNAFSPFRVFELIIYKRAVWHPPRSAISLRVKTFDEQHLPGSLLVQIIPPVRRIRSHRIGLSFAVGIYELDGNQLLIEDGRCLGDGKRVFEDGLDGPPDVYDLVASAKQGGGFGWEVVLDTLGACSVGLVDVDTLNWAAQGYGLVWIGGKDA